MAVDQNVERALDACSDAVEDAITQAHRSALAANIHPDAAYVATAIVVGAISGILDVFDNDWRRRSWPEAKAFAEHVAAMLAGGAKHCVATEHPDALPGLAGRIDRQTTLEINELKHRWAREGVWPAYMRDERGQG